MTLRRMPGVETHEYSLGHCFTCDNRVDKIKVFQSHYIMRYVDSGYVGEMVKLDTVYSYSMWSPPIPFVPRTAEA